MATTYAKARGGSPYSFAGNLMARSAAPITSLRATQALMGRPASVAAPLVATVINQAQEADHDTDSKSDSSVSSQSLLPISSDNGQITYNESDLKKAYQIADNAASSSDNGGLSSSNGDAAYNQLVSDMHSVLNSGQPEQAYRQAAEKPFYKDSNFWQTALMMVVAAASGARPLQMLQMGLGMRQKGHARDFLKANMDRLTSQYDPMSIEQALETGDLGKLKSRQLSPEQQIQMKMLEQNYTGQQSLQRQESLADYQDRLARNRLGMQQRQQIAMAALKGGGQGDLMNAIIAQESGGNPLAVSSKGAQGIVQIMPATAKNPGYGMEPIDLDNTTPAEQVEWARQYLQRMQAANNFSPAQTIAAYNAGPQAVKSAISKADKAGKPDAWLSYLPSETQNYVPSVMNRMGQGAATMGYNDRMQAIAATGRDPMTGKTATPAQQQAAQKAMGAASGVSAANPLAGLSSTIQKYASGLASNANKSTQLNKQRLAGYNDAKHFLEQYKAALARGDKDTAQSLVPSINNAIARSELGGTGMLPEADVEKSVYTGSLPSKLYNQGVLASTGLYSEAMQNRLEKQATTGGSTVAQNINQTYNNVKNNLVKAGVPEDQATIIADQGRAEDFDKYVQTDPQNAGALLAAESGDLGTPVGNSTSPEGTTKRVGGKTYKTVNGKWYQIN